MACFRFVFAIKPRSSIIDIAKLMAEALIPVIVGYAVLIDVSNIFFDKGWVAAKMSYGNGKLIAFQCASAKFFKMPCLLKNMDR